MWTRLPEEKKEKYKNAILGLASLTLAFSQKSEEDEICSPIINTKFQETAFSKMFDAVIEDIGNTAYDASINLTCDDGTEMKCLVGIKTFGIGSGLQKIAQFKGEHENLTELINIIRDNSKDENGQRRTKEEIDRLNYDYYLRIARYIAEVRNSRIRSAQQNLRGFRIEDARTPVETVYHVLMPSNKNEPPKISVGEMSYDEISIPDIEIDGCTNASKPINFSFNDGNHDYKFTSADSQLYMSFHNNEIVEEEWNVTYVNQPFEVFLRIAESIEAINGAAPAEDAETDVPETIITESYSWSLLNTSGSVELFSGFNAFYAVGSKMGEAQKNRSLDKLYSDFCGVIPEDVLREIMTGMRSFLLNRSPSREEKIAKAELRKNIMTTAETTENEEFTKRIKTLLFRPMNEVYIPIPNSRRFHEEHPNFFAENAGIMEDGTNRLATPKEERTFDLVFEPSGEMIRSYLTQDTGKAIESVETQSFLGDWILHGIFQLGDYEPLTAERMNEIEINGIRLFRTNTDNSVHICFIWIDEEEPPEDLI